MPVQMASKGNVACGYVLHGGARGGRNAKAQLVDERERTLEDSRPLTPRGLVYRVYCAFLRNTFRRTGEPSGRYTAIRREFRIARWEV
jgi:hypothetical protein